MGGESASLSGTRARGADAMGARGEGTGARTRGENCRATATSGEAPAGGSGDGGRAVRDKEWGAAGAAEAEAGEDVTVNARAALGVNARWGGDAMGSETDGGRSAQECLEY